ncbi:MAG: hypothetical protein HC915_12505 [Anaerolineae bacterium]|nr:hypothetical protein [Anaerolineae bacterium]
MTQQSVFRWRTGKGWLVLAGSGDFNASAMQDIEAAVLRRAVSHGPLAFIWAASDLERGDRYLDHVEELGGRTGYLVDIINEDDDSLRQQLTEAGIIVLGDGPQMIRLRNGLGGAVQEALQTAYERGATLYAHGDAAMLLGGWTLLPGETTRRGQGWLADALVVPRYTSERGADVRAVLAGLENAFGVGIGQNSALALGADGVVDLWGEQQVTVLLGKTNG